MCCLTTSSPRFYYRSDVWYTVTMQIVQNHNTDVLNDIANYMFFLASCHFPLISYVCKHSESVSYFLCPRSVGDYSLLVPVNAHCQMYVTIMCVFVDLERL
jgi:hypothetical protein